MDDTQMGMGRMDADGCVLTCTMSDCSYNADMECWAPQIQVGDSHPTCDTYTHDDTARRSQTESMVAMCGVGQCTFNEDMHCHARGITVGQHSQHADCVTFRP